MANEHQPQPTRSKKKTRLKMMLAGELREAERERKLAAYRRSPESQLLRLT